MVFIDDRTNVFNMNEITKTSDDGAVLLQAFVWLDLSWPLSLHERGGEGRGDS